MTHPEARNLDSDVFVIGLSGSPRRLHDPSEEWPNGVLVEDMGHDSAAVLVHRGEVVFGVEEERLNRIKHSNRFPIRALEQCLEQYFSQRTPSSRLHLACCTFPRNPLLRSSASQLLLDRLSELGMEVPRNHVHLIGHHFCHAASAFFPSPYEESLVVTIDGQGDDLCATVNIGKGTTLRVVHEIEAEGRSLGWMYRDVTRYLGFGIHDEYKVMGLAPYGDPARFRAEFRTLYELLPDGEWSLQRTNPPQALQGLLGPPRHKNDPLLQKHKDIAAALQESLERILQHFYSYHRAAHGQRHLCLAGGVALNCKANGLLLSGQQFEGFFVQPASHDGGAALGAALAAENALTCARPARPMRHLYWGPPVGPKEAAQELSKWSALIHHERCADVCGRAAALLESGKVIGWVQGQSEFGPRALGNRSILADPRPASNKERINAMVKKREAYRPFAPAVTEEAAGAYFAVAAPQVFPWMTITADVRPEKRAILGAVTHVDGSSRLQTVSRTDNPRFWRLLEAFKQLTGIPVLLNTSFNNNAEPIVDSVFDAVVCLLTTGLDYLIVDDYLVQKKAITPALLGAMVPSVPSYIQLNEVTQHDRTGRLKTYRTASNRYYSGGSISIGAPTARSLVDADGVRSLGQLLGNELESAFEEILDLWAGRLIELRPAGISQS